MTKMPYDNDGHRGSHGWGYCGNNLTFDKERPGYRNAEIDDVKCSKCINSRQPRQKTESIRCALHIIDMSRIAKHIIRNTEIKDARQAHIDLGGGYIVNENMTCDKAQSKTQ